MSRIRSIKPEFWSSAQVMECSALARLLFIGMWNFADDAGRLTNSAKRIKAQIFPSDDMSTDDVQRMIVELSSNDLLLIYDVAGTEYIQITGWKHQKIDHAQLSKLPAPPVDIEPRPKRNSPAKNPEFVEDSSKIRRTFAPEGKGEEKKEHNSEKQQPTTSGAPAAAWEEGLEKKCREAAGLENDPSYGLLQIGPIFDLIQAGWSLDGHVLPALRSAKAAGRRGKKWAYYVPIITDGAAAPPKRQSPPSAAPKPANIFDDETKWPLALRCWKSGNWPGTWGPQPFEPKCKIPADFVADWEKSQRVAA